MSRNSGSTWNKHPSPSDQFNDYKNIWLSPVHDNLMFILDKDEQVVKLLCYCIASCDAVCTYLCSCL